MNKKYLIIILALAVVAVFFGYFSFYKNKVNEVGNVSSNIKDITVSIGEESFTLVNGKAEKEYVPGSATKNTVSLFGEPVMGDLDKDGDVDAVLLLVNEPGGTGTFYYAVLAINNAGVYKATETMILGDRIAPQTIEIQEGRAVYNFAVRKVGESFDVQPSIGKSIWIHYDAKSNQIGEWVKDFEGEANPNVMTLGMKKWIWVKTEMSDGTVIMPNRTDAFSLTFAQDGKVTITTDCNSMGGTYIQNSTLITFSNLYSTMMYCEGSQEQVFSKSLGEVGSFMFTNKGELVLMIKYDSGSMIFR